MLTKTPQKTLNYFSLPGRAYGGELLKKRRGRRHGRPLTTKYTMHLVMRSSQAKGAWSFRRAQHRRAIEGIVQRFSEKHGVKILSMANVGNHLHFHIKLGRWQGYRPFIRAVTAAIAMAVTGTSRWRKTAKKFWDYRPFTRMVIGQRALQRVKDYIYVNHLESRGFSRAAARFQVAWEIAEDEDRRRGIAH